MNLTPEEAQSSLDEIDHVVARTRRALLAAHASGQLILWGVLWMIGFSAGQFTRLNDGFIWAPIGLIGGAISWWIGFRDPRPVQSQSIIRLGQFFLALGIFAIVWAVILHPFNFRHLAVYFATVFMFAYVVLGLWFGRVFFWLGGGITVAALIGLFTMPDWLELWMALVGGGSLVAAGLYIRNVRE